MTPNAEQALALHAEYGSNPRIIAHCQACARLSKVLLEKAKSRGRPINEEAAVAAALLHDIGRNRVQDANHGHVGAEILAKEGVDEVAVEIVKRHVGAGISAEEAVTLGFPKGDYIPRTDEQKIVCFVDKLLDGDKARPFDEEVKRFVKKGHDVPRLKKLQRDVDAMVGEDAEALVLAEARESAARRI